MGKFTPKKSEYRDAYQVVTDRIIALLETGLIPWKQNWSVIETDHPIANFATGENYHGVNRFLLMLSGFSSPFWMTFNQMLTLNKQHGCKITLRKGSTGTPVVKWVPPTVKTVESDELNEETGESEEIVIKRWGYYQKLNPVFNLSQFDNIPDSLLPAQGTKKDMKTIDATLSAMPELPAIEWGVLGTPGFAPKLDLIVMPAKESFTSEASLANTLFHEIVHWSGVETRLGRFKSTDKVNFGSDSYSFEELIAEFGSAFICAQLGYNDTSTVENSAAYIKNWVAVLKNEDNKTMCLKAVAKAMQAADYILNVQPEKYMEVTE